VGVNAIILVKNGAGSVSDARLLKNFMTGHLDELRDKPVAKVGKCNSFAKMDLPWGHFADELADTGSRPSLG